MRPIKCSTGTVGHIGSSITKNSERKVKFFSQQTILLPVSFLELNILLNIFARHGVFGEEPNLEVMGVWLCRGPKEIPDGLLKEHPQFEYYKTRQLDPRNNEKDNKMVREFFSLKEDDMFTSLGESGLKAQTLRWHK